MREGREAGTHDTDPSVVARQAAKRWIDEFASTLAERRFDRAARLFADRGYWRDLLALTWDLRTFAGRRLIEEGLAETVPATDAHGFALDDPTARAGTLGPFGPTVEGFFRFDTAVAHGRGFLRLVPSSSRPGDYEALTLLTSMDRLKNHDDRPFTRRRRENGTGTRSAENWLDQRTRASAYIDREPQVLVVGAGQAGLALAARLGQLAVDTLVVDRMERVGDNWRQRYHSLTLHNEICTNHLPFMPFPDTWPVYIPKDMLAHWLESYATSMELNVWTRTTFLGAEFAETKKRWNVRLQLRDGAIRTVHPRHVVLAVGVTGIAKVPEFAGSSSFTGTVIHSSRRTDDLEVTGKQALVVGAGTSGHDIAQDLYVRGADVTMLQRSPITVVSLEPSSVRAYDLYRRHEGSVPIDDVDLMSGSIPFDLVRQLHGPLSKQMQRDDSRLLERLGAVGFALDNGEDDTGFFLKLLRYHGGYYIDVGASELIADRKIRLKTGVRIDRFETDRVVFSDGSSQAADLVVLATGYTSLQDAVRRMFGDDVADRVGPVWGLDESGELRNMWTRTAQDGLFIAGGTLTMSRFYSRFTALLIRAELDGLVGGSRTVTNCPTEARSAAVAA